MTAANFGTTQDAGGGLELFGITLTGKIIGILLGIGGIGLAVYGTLNYTQPAQQQIDNLKVQITTLDGEIASASQNGNKLEATKRQLAEEKAKNTFVLGLLPTLDSLDTLITDINRQIPQTTEITIGEGLSTVSFTVDSRLQAFTPKTTTGAGAQHTVYSFDISFDATFPAVIRTIQNLEKLRTFMVVRNIKLSIKPIPPSILKFQEGVQVNPGDLDKIVKNLPPIVGVSFTLEAYVPKALAPATPPQ